MSTQAPSGVDEVHILSTPEGMSYDEESVLVTAAMLPQEHRGEARDGPQHHLLERRGDEFMKPFFPGDQRRARRAPNENVNGEGHWSSMGNDPVTREPLTVPWSMDQLAHKAWGVVAIGTCASYGGWLDEALRPRS